MADSNPLLERSILEGSDKPPDTFCEPCYTASDKVKPVAVYCINCDDKLCKECFTSHKGHTLFKTHKLVKTSATPHIQPTTMSMIINNVRKCMPTISLIIVAIIFTSIKMVLNSHTEEMSKLAKNIENSKEQINKLTVQLETLRENNDTDVLFIAMKHAQDQHQSMEVKLDKLDRLKFIQKAKRPFHFKDMTVTASSDQPFHLQGSLVLPNKQILITDWNNSKLKLIDTNTVKIISKIHLSGYPFDITKVKGNEIAVTVSGPPCTIQFISVSKNVMSKVREITVDGQCKGIAYNDRDQTLIVTFILPPKVKILDMAGTEIKCIEHDSKGVSLFSNPYHTALTPDMLNIYVTDWYNNSVTLLFLNGDVKAVYKDKTDTIKAPVGVYVHKSGLVYVVGSLSNTVHELDPESGEFKIVLEKKDGLFDPRSISYCKIEDNMYIGMKKCSVLKVFQMK